MRKKKRKLITKCTKAWQKKICSLLDVWREICCLPNILCFIVVCDFVITNNMNTTAVIIQNEGTEKSSTKLFKWPKRRLKCSKVYIYWCSVCQVNYFFRNKSKNRKLESEKEMKACLYFIVVFTIALIEEQNVRQLTLRTSVHPVLCTRKYKFMALFSFVSVFVNLLLIVMKNFRITS